MRSTLRKLPGGCYAVTVCLAPDLIAYANTQWRAQGFVNVDDYLNCVLNTALFKEEAAEPPPPLMASFDEMDDDIPFDPIPLPTIPRVTKPSGR